MLFFFLFLVVILAVLTTLGRVAVHSAKGFSNFRQSNSDLAKTGSLIGDAATVIGLPAIFLVFFWGEGGAGNEFGFLFSGWQRFFWLGLILSCTVGYFLAVYHDALYASRLELLLYFLAGLGIVINVMIAWPMLIDGGAIIIPLLGNLPIILLFALVFTRRHALLMHHSTELLEQRRFADNEVLDYLPDYDPSKMYQFSGSAGNLLQQSLPLKIAFSIVAGAVFLGLCFVAFSLMGFEVII